MSDITYPGDAGATTYLLTVRGVAATTGGTEGRSLHNRTAGAEAGVAAARALGDLSHNVYSGLTDHNAGELLFLDFWNSLSGMAQFFADPQVQAGGNLLFTKREAPVWAPARDFGSFHLATPSGRSVAAVGLLRSAVTTVEDAARAFRAYAAVTINRARRHGLVSHSLWVRVPDPGQPPVAEVLGVDTWLDADDMAHHYDQNIGYDELGPVLVGTPDTSVWRAGQGDWVEW